jgi:CheY-like chemotaxis protein
VQILVLEDNPADVELLRLALNSAGLDCEMTVIDDGADALAFARDTTGEVPALAILDLNLPKHDGLEILVAMRSNPTLCQVPVAIFSSSSSQKERSEIAPHGVKRFITKPADLEEFLKVGLVVRDLLTETADRPDTTRGSQSL